MLVVDSFSDRPLEFFWKQTVPHYWLNCFCMPMRMSFHMTSSPYQHGVGNKIKLKTDDGWESDFLPGTDNSLLLSPCKT